MFNLYVTNTRAVYICLENVYENELEKFKVRRMVVGGEGCAFWQQRKLTSSTCQPAKYVGRQAVKQEVNELFSGVTCPPTQLHAAI